MSFGFPHDETRFFKAGCFIYKFKFCFREQMDKEDTCYDQELEEIIRTVLGNVENLQPFCSPDFKIFPYKNRWQDASDVLGQHADHDLKPYPFVLTLHLEKRLASYKKPELKRSRVKEETSCASESEPSKKVRTLEDAILQDLMEDLVSESRASQKRRRVNTPHNGEVVEGNSQDLDLAGFSLVAEDAMTAGGQNEVTKGDSMLDNNDTARFGNSPEEEPKESSEEEEEEEEDEVAEPRPGLWRIIRNTFPFSLFLRDV